VRRDRRRDRRHGAAPRRHRRRLGDGVRRAVPDCRLLVNNAGGAKGLEPVIEADEEDWRWMYETNVIGSLRVTRR
jgi:NADP-dependent 3-hydroxy acid dehydrogenase YdfG